MRIPLHDQTSAGAAATGSPEVSVIIPAFRGHQTIDACLEAVVAATSALRAEILVVESTGEEAAARIRARFPAVRVIVPAGRLSAGAARNLGFAHARGRDLLCVDQDCLVPGDWAERLRGLLARSGVGAAGGSIAVANPQNLAGWGVYFLEFFTHVPVRGAPRTDNFLIGANSAWRAEAVRGGIFPDQTLGEDLLATAAVRARGFTVLYDPTLTVRHHNREGWREFFRYVRAMGCAAARSQSRLGGRAIALVRRFPWLAFGIPVLVLPRILGRLVGAPRGYLPRFLLLLPLCLLGQLLWANAFRRGLAGPEMADASQVAGAPS